jgi:predicted TIM-barrel fold metal-dependent hydrolase
MRDNQIGCQHFSLKVIVTHWGWLWTRELCWLVL